MKINFRKIASTASSVLMVGSTVAMAAAANYPAPFVTGGVADVGIVYGSNAASGDLVAAAEVTSNLQTALSDQGGSGGDTPTGGDFVQISQSSDNLNLGDTFSVLTGSIDDSDMSTLLADGTYVADDNDEFDYEQKINLGTPQFIHFRDSDYEALVGLDERTPTLGFKLSSNDWVLNYTLDFKSDAESDIVSGDLDDLEGSDFPLMGKTYYVSDFKNGSTTGNFGKLTLLDSATIGHVSEGETVSVEGHDVSINFIDNDEVTFMVDGELAPSSGKLQKGETYKLSDGSYIGVRDVSKLEVSGEIGSASFSIGSGKLEITHKSDIKLNDDSVQGVKGYTYSSSGNTKLSKIVVEWRTDEEVFLTPESELLMPGFEALKFTMNDFVRNGEEKIVVEKDSDESMEMTIPIEDGIVSFNFLYSNASGEFTGIGKATDERLATTSGSLLTFTEKNSGGTDQDSYFVASYNISGEAESYLLRAQVTTDTDAGRNETTIQKNVEGTWTDVCEEKTDGDSCDIGDVTLTIGTIRYTSGGTEDVNFTAGSDVNFNTIYTAGGLRVYLPYLAANATTMVNGAVNFTYDDGSGSIETGHGYDNFYLFMDGENKDDDIAAGTEFNITIDDTSDGNLQVSQVNNAGNGGPSALEVGDSTSVYEKYLATDVAPRILHYTKPDEDYAEIYYPSGDSESYAEVFVTEAIAGSGGSGELGGIMVMDSEVSSVSTKNLIVIGGSCINTVAASILGSDSAICGAGFTDSTGVGSGSFLIETFTNPFSGSKVATLVAGYDASDTTNAATFLRTQEVSTAVGDKYVGTSATSATLV